MDDDRRDRYADAIKAAWEVGMLTESTGPDYVAADAAMAVADAEMADATTGTSGLARALVKNQMRVERVRAAADKWGVHPHCGHRRSSTGRGGVMNDDGKWALIEMTRAAQGAIAEARQHHATAMRLRAELAYSQIKREDNWTNVEYLSAENARLRATIDRVRAVLDEWYGTSDASALGSAIRTALNGESA